MTHNNRRTTDAVDPQDTCSSYGEWCEREGYDPVSRRYVGRDRGFEDREDES